MVQKHCLCRNYTLRGDLVVSPSSFPSLAACRPLLRDQTEQGGGEFYRVNGRGLVTAAHSQLPMHNYTSSSAGNGGKRAGKLRKHVLIDKDDDPVTTRLDWDSMHSREKIYSPGIATVVERSGCFREGAGFRMQSTSGSCPSGAPWRTRQTRMPGWHRGCPEQPGLKSLGSLKQ